MDEPFGALDTQTRVVMQENPHQYLQHFASRCCSSPSDIEESIFLVATALRDDRAAGAHQGVSKVPCRSAPGGDDRHA